MANKMIKNDILPSLLDGKIPPKTALEALRYAHLSDLDERLIWAIEALVKEGKEISAENIWKDTYSSELLAHYLEYINAMDGEC